MKIAVWADYTWCEEDDIENYHWMSDDYMLLECPVELQYVDRWLVETKPQG